MSRAKVEHYRRQAALIRAVADNEDDAAIKADILWLAEEYDKWATDQEKRDQGTL